MSLASIEQEVVAEIESLVGGIKGELGIYGSAIAASVKYDIQQLKGQAVTLVEADLTQLWTTVKEQAAAQWATIQNLAFPDMVAAVKQALANINWKAVATNLEGVGLTTLETLARTAVEMLISGVMSATAAA
jgi:hypothetical protein